MKNNNEEKSQRVVTFLNREEVDFLDKLGKDALFSTGAKISRSKLIAWLVDFIEDLRINGENIKSEKDFENRIRRVLQRGQFLPATEGNNVPLLGSGTKLLNEGGVR